MPRGGQRRSHLLTEARLHKARLKRPLRLVHFGLLRAACVTSNPWAGAQRCSKAVNSTDLTASTAAMGNYHCHPPRRRRRRPRLLKGAFSNAGRGSIRELLSTRGLGFADAEIGDRLRVRGCTLRPLAGGVWPRFAFSRSRRSSPAWRSTLRRISPACRSSAAPSPLHSGPSSERKPVPLPLHDCRLFFASARVAASWGRRSSASWPLPVSIST